MFRSLKRFLAVILAIVLPLLAALWSTFLSAAAKQHPSVPYFYVGAIAILSGSGAYFTHVRPAKDLEKPILAFLTVLANAPMSVGRKAGIGPRLNLMVVVRPWYQPWHRELRVVWGVGMDNYPDVNFHCRHDQGVAGEALRTRMPVLDDCECEDKTRFAFDKQQLLDTRHLTAVWSWPIYETNAKGKQTGKVVGVVNLDATLPGSFPKMQERHQNFEKHLKKFCEVASTVL